MAHPSVKIPRNTYVLDSSNDVLTAADGEFFSSFTVVSGTSVTVNGGGIFEFLAENGSDGASHLTTDGSATLASTHAAGIYEVLGNKDISIPVAAGMTVYGRFTKINVGSSKVIAYK
tara:strand:- start:12 stop:362 length:351 start_codon:yes stop_codon:yes gene_type:complete